MKSQPLHNFDLPHLRWAHKSNHHSNANHHHRFRRRGSPPVLHYLVNNSIPSSSSSPSRAATAVAESDPDNDDTSNAPQVVKTSIRTPRKPFSFAACSSQRKEASKEKGDDDGVEEGEMNDGKPWNLRPRRFVTLPAASFKKGEKMSDEIVLYQRNDNSSSAGGCGPSSKPIRFKVPAGVEVNGGPNLGSERQRKVVEEKKRKLWISLSREEIEEDIYSLTGSRPARRPKKRPKTVQKQMDTVFPGLFLVGMNVDSYRVHESLR